MKGYHRIDKSVYGRGRYIGYAGNEVWIITRNQGLAIRWVARRRDNPNAFPLFARTLKFMNRELDIFDAEFQQKRQQEKQA